MRNIRRSVALALAAIMMMAMNMVSFAADTAPAETEAVESVTRSTNGESVLLDKVYFACEPMLHRYPVRHICLRCLS